MKTWEIPQMAEINSPAKTKETNEKGDSPSEKLQLC